LGTLHHPAVLATVKAKPCSPCSALGSLRESLACLEVAAAMGYLPAVEPPLRRRYNHVIGTLVRLV